MALPYQFQGGMFGAPQGYGRPMMSRGMGYGGGYGGMQKPAMLGGNTMAQNPMGGMNSRGGYLDNRGVYDTMRDSGGLNRGGYGGQSMMRPGGNMAWGQPPRQPPGYNPDMGGAGGGGGAVSDPMGAFRPPPFYSEGALGTGMFAPQSTGNMDQNPGSGAGATGFTGIPPWGPNTPSPMPPDGFGGPAQPGAPNTPVTGGPPGSVAPNGQPYTQIDYTNRAQLGTPQGDQQASTNALLGFINQYGREQGLQMYRQMLDNQAMPSNALGGGGELPPINLNRGIAYR